MNQVKKYLIVIGILQLFLVVAVAWMLMDKRPKSQVGFVRSALVLDRFAGMKEAKQRYETKAGGWKAEVDTAVARFQRKIAQYEAEATKFGEEKKKKVQAELQKEQQALEQYAGRMEEQAAAENEKMVQGVLNQVNSYIEQYGKNNNYEMILGVTTVGNILYGNNHNDLTDEIIAGLNNSYLGK